MNRIASPLKGPVGVSLRRRQVRRPLEVATFQGFLNQGCGFLAFPLRTAIWGRAQQVEHTFRAKVMCGGLQVLSSGSWVPAPASDQDIPRQGYVRGSLGSLPRFLGCAPSQAVDR